MSTHLTLTFVNEGFEYVYLGSSTTDICSIGPHGPWVRLSRTGTSSYNTVSNPISKKLELHVHRR